MENQFSFISFDTRYKEATISLGCVNTILEELSYTKCKTFIVIKK